jgi:DNA-binding transcriptional MerR regulator
MSNKFKTSEAARICKFEKVQTFQNLSQRRLIFPDFPARGTGKRQMYSGRNLHQIGILKYLTRLGYSLPVASAIVNDTAITGQKDQWFEQVAGFDESKAYYYPYLMIRTRDLGDETLTVTSMVFGGELHSHIKEMTKTHKKMMEFDQIQLVALKPLIDEIEGAITEEAQVDA